jgi:predicted RNA binding protein YcfA (HicA-like mRNA interferase family)
MTRRLPALTPQEVLQVLERNGFVLRRVKGSHYHLTHSQDHRLRVSVPYHTKNLKRLNPALDHQTKRLNG